VTLLSRIERAARRLSCLFGFGLADGYCFAYFVPKPIDKCRISLGPARILLDRHFFDFGGVLISLDDGYADQDLEDEDGLNRLRLVVGMCVHAPGHQAGRVVLL